MEDKKNVSFAALKLIDLTIKDHAKQLQKKKTREEAKVEFYDYSGKFFLKASFFSKYKFTRKQDLRLSVTR